jgi:Ca2+-transporting ATPase
MAFVTLGLIEMVHSFNIRSEESIFKCGVFKNKFLCLAFLLGLIMQVRNSSSAKC